jgi:uncharacterized damage-inducible protein DinB
MIQGLENDMSNAKQKFLETFDHEHATTMRLLRAFPADRAGEALHPGIKTARELAWVFALERGLGTRVWNDEFANRMPSGGAPPPPPESWDELLEKTETANAAYREIISAASDDDLAKNVTFMTAPKTMGQISRMDWIWFLLHDEIHHRGQFSVYLRMAGAKVPSIYGPTADEPWF